MKRHLRHDGPLFLDLVSQTFVLRRIRSSDTAPEHGHRAAASRKRAPMGSRIGAASQPADDGQPCLRQVAGQAFGDQTSASRRPPRTDHRYGQFVRVAQGP